MSLGDDSFPFWLWLVADDLSVKSNCLVAVRVRDTLGIISSGVVSRDDLSPEEYLDILRGDTLLP